MARLKFLAIRMTTYSGYDGTRPIDAQKGETVDVSQATADRLMLDYPGDWMAMEGLDQPEEPAEKEPEPEPDADPDDQPPSGKKPQRNKAITKPKKAKRKGW